MLGLVGGDLRGGGPQVAARKLGDRIDIGGDRDVLEVVGEVQRLILGPDVGEVELLDLLGRATPRSLIARSIAATCSRSWPRNSAVTAATAPRMSGSAWE